MADTVWCSKNIGRYCVSTTTCEIGFGIWPLAMEAFLWPFLFILQFSLQKRRSNINTDNKSLSYWSAGTFLFIWSKANGRHLGRKPACLPDNCCVSIAAIFLKFQQNTVAIFRCSHWMALKRITRNSRSISPARFTRIIIAFAWFTFVCRQEWLSYFALSVQT